jgi:hypothetical protein
MKPESLMRSVAEAFEKSDLRPLLNAIDDKCVWKSAASVAGMFRFGGQYTGHEGVVEVTSQISTTYWFYSFQPKEIVSMNDIVWGIFEVEGDFRDRQKPSGHARPIKFECAIRWRVAGNKIVEHQCFFDTAGLLLQQGQLAQT